MIVLPEEDWKLERCGKATASEFHKAIAKTKSGWATSRRNYAGNLIVERLTRHPTNGYQNFAMQWGHENEPLAHKAYQLENDIDLEYAPDGHHFWVQHPDYDLAGASPDALAGNEGVVEFKCPFESGIHLEYYDEGINKTAYRTQGLFQLACMPQRQWIDLVSFDPRMPLHMQLVVQRTNRKDVQAEIDALNEDLRGFLDEIAERMSKYNPN